jgi:hypothetical protein
MADGLRKVYSRKGIVHVPFKGGFFRAPEDTCCAVNGRYKVTPKVGTRAEVHVWLSEFIYETWKDEPSLALAPRGKPTAKAKRPAKAPVEGGPDRSDPYYAEECYWTSRHSRNFVWHGTKAHYQGFVYLEKIRLRTPFAHDVATLLGTYDREGTLARSTVADAPNVWALPIPELRKKLPSLCRPA